MTDCKIEDLGVGNLKIIQNKKGYLFTSDAVILANFVTAKKNDIVVEFGAGSAIISTLIWHKEKPKHIHAFEIQNEAFELARQSLRLNSLEKNITLHLQNLTQSKEFVSNVDIVVCNPPYIKQNSGLLPKNEIVAISKAEIKTNLDEILKSATEILKDGGNFYICQSPSRLAELIFKLKQQKLEPKRMFFSYPQINFAPSCVFLHCVKNGKEDLKILPPLITNNDKGEYVEIIRKLFKKEI